MLRKQKSIFRKTIKNGLMSKMKFSSPSDLYLMYKIFYIV